MSRRLFWISALLMLALGALPAGAADSDTPGTIEGTIVKYETGDPFVLTGDRMLIAEAFATGTGERVASAWISNGEGTYEISDLPPGHYKVRFRLLTPDGEGIARYRWNANKPTYATATPVTVSPGRPTTVNASLRPLAGATVSGTVAGTGNPAASECVYVDVFEAGGVSLGMITVPSSLDGTWTLGRVPAGSMTAVAAYYDAPLYGCPTFPSWLFKWYGTGGASGGWDSYQAGTMRADAALLATATRFAVPTSGTLPGIDFTLTPTPSCRAKAPTVIGTTLANTINGTTGSDVILGLAGNDIIHGKAGRDTICGGIGNDTIYGDRGNDWLAGEAGNDTLIGGVGTDTATGGAGTDTCQAETPKTCEASLP